MEVIHVPAAQRLMNEQDLEAYLEARSVPFHKGPDGSLRVPIPMMANVSGDAELRFTREPPRFECATMLPIPLTPDSREAVAAALPAMNRDLPASRFIAGEGAVFHVAAFSLDEDGSLSPTVVDGAIAATRAACQKHFDAIFLAAVASSGPAPPAEEVASGPQLLRHVPAQVSDARLAELRREAAARRPTFAHRLSGHVLVEEVENPWFKAHRILSIQSPWPMPAMEMTACIAPDGRLRVLSGQLATLNEMTRTEPVELAGDSDALSYVHIVTSWTRAADFPELPVASFAEIPFRPDLSAQERALIDGLRGDVAARVAPRSFVRTDRGWRLDAWVVSVSRLVHRIADVDARGVVAVDDDIVVPALPVPPGRAWRAVDGRVVPVG